MLIISSCGTSIKSPVHGEKLENKALYKYGKFLYGAM